MPQIRVSVYGHLHGIASSLAWLSGGLSTNSRDERTAPNQYLDLGDENIAHSALHRRKGYQQGEDLLFLMT